MDPGPRAGTASDADGDGTVPGDESVLDALADEDCREILRRTTEGPKTVRELTEGGDISSSSAYRKVRTLAEAGMLSETLRIRDDGKHTSEYVCRFDRLAVSLAGERVSVEPAGRVSASSPDDGSGAAASTDSPHVEVGSD